MLDVINNDNDGHLQLISKKKYLKNIGVQTFWKRYLNSYKCTVFGGYFLYMN